MAHEISTPISHRQVAQKGVPSMSTQTTPSERNPMESVTITPATLRRAYKAVADAERRLELVRHLRDEVIRLALDAGWGATDIAMYTGVTVGRVSQIRRGGR